MYTEQACGRSEHSNACREDDDGNAENVSMNSQAGDGQARRAAAQAVIELTDRLAAAEEEAAALRKHLKHTRNLTKVTLGVDSMRIPCLVMCGRHSTSTYPIK